jgi:hypothetical protein
VAIVPSCLIGKTGDRLQIPCHGVGVDNATLLDVLAGFLS